MRPIEQSKTSSIGLCRNPSLPLFRAAAAGVVTQSQLQSRLTLEQLYNNKIGIKLNFTSFLILLNFSCD